METHLHSVQVGPGPIRPKFQHKTPIQRHLLQHKISVPKKRNMPPLELQLVIH